MMRSLRIFGHGHLSGHREGRSITPIDGPKLLVKRQWRLGDVVMCEPACRALARLGTVIFSTRDEYHPVVNFFSGRPPRTMSYPPPSDPRIVVADEIFDLDTVTLDHPGFETKVDAFVSACGMDPTSMPRDERVPIIEPGQQYQAWAKMKLESLRILDRSIIAVVRQSYDPSSPRSLPPAIIDAIADRLSREHHIVYVGVTPVRVGASRSIHNLTGCTPDVTFAAGLIMQCRLLLTVDTGLMHVAGAMGVPMVTIMGPTRPDDLATVYDRTSVLDVGPECSPCYDRGCESPCLHRIDPEEIYRLCLSRISSPNAPTEVHRAAS